MRGICIARSLVFSTRGELNTTSTVPPARLHERVRPSIAQWVGHRQLGLTGADVEQLLRVSFSSLAKSPSALRPKFSQLLWQLFNHISDFAGIAMVS